MPRDCPICGLVNPDSAPACDCGYSFAYAATVGRVQRSAAAQRNMVVGGLICFAGFCFTLLSVAASPVTGVFVFAWGAIVLGVTQFIRGAVQLARQRHSSVDAGNAESSAKPDQPRE